MPKFSLVSKLDAKIKIPGDQGLTGTPANTLDTNDPGDDVAQRFRYQHCCAAIYALQLIRDGANIELIVCENFEDVIVQRSDGQFIGIQIKTRDLSQHTFKASDAQIVAAFARFCDLDRKFPGSFCKFEFLTNHGFWDINETANNLPHILNTLKARGGVKGLKSTNPVRTFVTIVGKKCNLPEDQVVGALLKCSLTSKDDTIRSVERDVVEAVSECPNMGSHTLSTLQLIAEKMIKLAQNASSKALSGSILDLYDPAKDFAAVLAGQQLAGKHIRKEHIEALIEEALSANASFETLCINEGMQLPDVPKDLAVMYEKMDRGKVQAPRVQEIENLVRSFEALYLRWARKYGAPEANRRSEDLLTLVRFDCTEARVAAESNGEPFGPAMYEALKALVEKRCSADPAKVYQCRPEHLLGAAGIVTQKCKAWWSKEFQPISGSP